MLIRSIYIFMFVSVVIVGDLSSQATKAPQDLEVHIRRMRAFENYDSLVLYSERVIKEIEKKNNKNDLAVLLTEFSFLSVKHTKYEEALNWGDKAITMAKKAPNDSLTAKGYLYMGTSHYEMGNYDKAAVNFHESLKYSERNSYLKLMASAYNQLGLTHAVKKNHDYETAFKYYKKAEELNLKIRNWRDLGFVWLRMGAIYSSNKDYVKAESYLSKALRLADSTGITTVQKWTLEAYASMFRQQEKYKQALPILQRSLELSMKEKQWSGIISSQVGIADIYSLLGDQKKALTYSDSSIQNCINNKVYSFLSYAYACRSMIYERNNDYKNAFFWYKKRERIKDSLFKQENNANLNELEKKYETQKKEKELADNKNELLVQKADNEKQQAQRNFFIAGTVLFLGFSIFIFRGYKQKQKANEIIAQQKKEVEIQKGLIEEKQKEIVDSINYAKRIQKAHLPHEKYIAKKLNELKETDHRT